MFILKFQQNLLLASLLAIITHAEMSLVQVVMVSRHGIRSPYPPTNGTVNDFTSYSPLIFPDAADWGMTEEAFANQYLTPHGRGVMTQMGAYYRQQWGADGLDEVTCETMTCYADFADGATRDNDTAYFWLQGFALCPDLEIQLVNETTNPDMQPVLSDHYQITIPPGDTDDNPAMQCLPGTEEQVSGVYGGDVDALTEMYTDAIQTVVDILQMTGNTTNPYSASICANVNPAYDPSVTPECTLFDTGYTWTGTYFTGMFYSPVFFASYFAEAWMFQYLNNLQTWAFGQLQLSQLVDLYALHTEEMWLGTNYWNSLAYSSQQLSYIVGSLEQMVTGKPVAGIPQDVDQQLVLLFSHDTNVLMLRRLLDLNWVPAGFGDNVATTGGALSFELWQNSSDAAHYVKLKYVAATPDQQRNSDTLTDPSNPPSVATLVLPSCGDDYCPWNTFKSIAINAVNVRCIEQPLQGTIQAMLDSENGGGGGSSGSGNDDEGLGQKGWTLVFTTAAVTLAIALLMWLVYVHFMSNGYNNSSSKGGAYGYLNDDKDLSNSHNRQTYTQVQEAGGDGDDSAHYSGAASYVPPAAVATSSRNNNNPMQDKGQGQGQQHVDNI